MQTDKTAIILDTNILIPSNKKTHDFAKLHLDNYEKTLKSIKYSNLQEHVKIFLPEIVFLELLSNHKRNLTNEINKWTQNSKKFENMEEIQINGFDEIDIAKTCESIKEFHETKLNIIKIPEDKTKLFSKILRYSIEKMPPFEEGRSDKGFKDAILFFSIIEFARHNWKYKKYVFFSKDKIFKNEERFFKKVFKYETTRDIEIINTKDIITYINEEFSLFTELKKYLEDCFFPCIEKYYEDKEFVEIYDHEYEINELDIYEDNIHIYKVGTNEFEVNVWPSFYLDNYCGYWEEPCVGKKRCNNQAVYCSYYGNGSIMQEDTFLFTLTDNKWEIKLIDRNYELY